MGSVPDPPKEQTRQGFEAAEFVPSWQYLSDEQLRDLDEQLRDLTTERGVGYVEPLPRPVSEELACSEHPPCTDLLVDPKGVFIEKERWPDHLCHVLFLRMSTYEWASSNSVALSTIGLEEYLWLRTWPLPVGQEAVATKLTACKGELCNLVPFEEMEEALWAVRLEAADCTLDLFGLGTPYGSEEERVYEMGELRYVLKGRGTSLFSFVARAERWWAWFRDKSATGRPVGSGTWKSPIEFWIALRATVRGLRAADKEITEEKVAGCLNCTDRVLRRWRRQYGIPWEEVLKIP